MTPASTAAWALPASLASKLDLFARNLDQYLKPDYKEAQTRVEFIDSLLITLGWGVGNTAGAAERFKEVVVEPTQQVEGRKRGRARSCPRVRAAAPRSSSSRRRNRR